MEMLNLFSPRSLSIDHEPKHVGITEISVACVAGEFSVVLLLVTFIFNLIKTDGCNY